MMSELERVCLFNRTAGFDGERTELKDLDLPFNLIDEEYFELAEALDNGDRVETLDALGDLLVVVSGAAYRMGVNPDELLKRINDSNMSKFCENKDDAIASVLKYADSTEYEGVHYRKVGDYYVVMGYKIGASQPKILKGIHYQEPKLEDLA